MYGYQDDNVEQSGSGLKFGLNQNVKMVEFKYNPNCGKDGVEMEGLDIAFQVGEKTMRYRQFPVTKVFDKQQEITDPNHPLMKAAYNDFNAIITHIMKCFVSEEVYRAALSRPINTFKDFCLTLQSILPVNYKEVDLDLFAHYQWTIKGENTQTFLEIPKKLKHGKFLCASVPSESGWQVVSIENPADSLQLALSYKNNEGQLHPFTRTGWFMKSNFANKQVEQNTNSLQGTTSTDSNQDSW